MATVGLLAGRIAILFGFMAIGWILYRLKFLTDQGIRDLSNILLRLVVPATIVQSFLVERTAENTRGFLVSFVLAFVAIAFSAVIARIVFGSKKVVEQFGTAFANAGFFGIPVVQSFLGDDGVFLIAAFVTMIFLFQWTYGVHLYTKDKTIFKPKKLLTNPVLVAFAIALVIFFFRIPVPEALATPVRMITPLNTPLAMFILGGYLARTPFKSLFTDGTAYLVALLRLAVIPVLTILLMLLVPAEYDAVRLAVLIPASAPVGVNVAVFAGLHGQDHGKAVRIVCLSTLFVIVTMPLVVLLAETLWS